MQPKQIHLCLQWGLMQSTVCCVLAQKTSQTQDTWICLCLTRITLMLMRTITFLHMLWITNQHTRLGTSGQAYVMVWKCYLSALPFLSFSSLPLLNPYFLLLQHPPWSSLGTCHCLSASHVRTHMHTLSSVLTFNNSTTGRSACVTFDILTWISETP